MKNKILKFWPYLFSGLLLYLLFRELEDYNPIKDFSRISYQIILISLTFFFVTKLLNTWRYSTVYKIKQKTNLFWGLSFCNFMLTLIPFRLGEYSYVKYFKDKFSIDREIGVKKLLLIRSFDYLVVYLLFVVSSFFVAVDVKSQLILYISLFTLVGLLVGAVFFLSFKKVFQDERLGKIKIIKKIANFLQAVLIEFRSISWKKFNKIFFGTLIYWLSRLGFGYVIFLLLGVEISFGLFVFVSFLLLLIGLLPIKTFAGFGIFEGGWVYFLALAGLEYEKALPLVVNFHLINLLPILVYGIIGWLMIKWKLK